MFARATVLSRFSAALLRANVLADAARCIAGALRILGGTMRLPGTVLARADERVATPGPMLRDTRAGAT